MAKYDRVQVIKDGPLGWLAFTAWVGAAVYFFQQNPTFLGLILAVLKAAVWPAYVVYEVLTALGVH